MDKYSHSPNNYRGWKLQASRIVTDQITDSRGISDKELTTKKNSQVNQFYLLFSSVEKYLPNWYVDIFNTINKFFFNIISLAMNKIKNEQKFLLRLLFWFISYSFRNTNGWVFLESVHLSNFSLTAGTNINVMLPMQ